MDNEKVKLNDFILDHYSLGEIKNDLCFHLGVDSDDLEGGTRVDKARGLVEYLARRRRLGDLHVLLKQQRAELYAAAFPAAPVIEIAITSTSDLARNPRQIFISHATSDAAFAHRLADDLRRAGYAIWIAPESIPPGQWVRAINRGLEQSGVMLLVLSPAAVVSPWVDMETNVAIELERAGEMRFIPLLRQEGRFPALWRAYQRVPFDGGYETGLAALLARLGDRPVETFRRNVSTPLPDRRFHEKTGIELIRIPAGPFLYGSADRDELAYENEKPQRTIELPEYWIGRYPVTNAQFNRFVQATRHRTTAEREGYGWGWTGKEWGQIQGADWQHPNGPQSSIDGKHNHPVVLVSWDDAQAFRDWAGLALPTEEQWEKAARGKDGRLWPWGDEPPTDKHCNFSMNIGDTTPVGEYSPKGDSPYGCADMAGNVWEWMETWYEEGKARALRGGAWGNDDRVTRAAFRDGNYPHNGNGIVGFRVVELLSDPGF